MAIAMPPTAACIKSRIRDYNSIEYLDKQSLLKSMSQDYHQAGIFSFSNGSFERSQQEQQQQQQQHMAQQIRRDKLRNQGFEPPPSFVGMEEEASGVLPVYETAGMLQEMFNSPSGGGGTATELLENQISLGYRIPRTIPPTGASSAADWFLHRQGIVGGGGLGDSKNQPHQISNINAESAAAMQLFLMNPQHQRSTSPPPAQNHLPNSSTLHMLLPNQSSSSSPSNPQAFHTAPGGGFGQFAWISNSGNATNPNEIPGVVEGQGLSLSLSSSLHQFEAAKAEELRMEEGGMMFFGQGGGSTPATYRFKNMAAGGGGPSQFQGRDNQNHQLHDGFGSLFGAVNILRNSKYSKAAQELLEEFCSVGRGQFRKNKFKTNPSSNASDGGGAGGGNSSSSSKDLRPLSAADRVEHQKRKVKLLSMLDEVDRRYNHYCEQMQMVVNSFDMVMGFGAAVPYTCLAQKAMSRHFRCLKDAISAQIKQTCELLGDKDAGTSGITKGETPRLKILEQSLRQQRAFHHMGTMEQEAWRPQRGLPERSVNILRAWLFEHFLHPYPSDADKHLLARQTGLSKNQVSNWFINARVRLWKPMVEEMYQQESKDEPEESQRDQSSSSSSARINNAQTPTPPAVAFTPHKRSEINAIENDPSFMAINKPCLSEIRAKISTDTNVSMPLITASNSAALSFPAMHESDSLRRNHSDFESTLIRFGTSSGDVSLTLGLRHAGNLSEKSPFFG